MIKSVSVINPKNETLLLELRRPESSGLYISNIEGLGPPKANINSTELATLDGGLFSSSRITERNVVLTLGMLFNPTIEDSRLLTYKFFPIKKQIQLIIKTDRRNAVLTGFVESNEPIIFAKQETTQISIICPDPFFYEIGGEESVFSGIQPLFEFPFSNESLTDNLIEFGNIALDTRAILKYDGDVDTGVVITMHALGPVENIIVYNIDTSEKMSVNTDKIINLTGQPFGTGDDIIISTVRGNRYAKLLREGVYTNIISALPKDVDWFQISNGDNIFAFTASGGENDLMVTFSYRNAYGGV